VIKVVRHDLAVLGVADLEDVVVVFTQIGHGIDKVVEVGSLAGSSRVVIWVIDKVGALFAPLHPGFEENIRLVIPDFAQPRLQGWG